MKIFSVDNDGNFHLKRKTTTAGRKVVKQGVFGICFQISPDGSEVDIKVASPDGQHHGGLAETDAIKQFFMITEFDGKPVQTSQGARIESVGIRSKDVNFPDDPTPPPPAQGILSKDEITKRQTQQQKSPAIIRQNI